jgi:hypothetical protein
MPASLAYMAVLPIHRIDRGRAEQFEQLGSKPKFWFRDGERRLLFKADDRGTGEDWAEVVACRLCDLLNLPHVDYELAAEYDGYQFLRPGVICENMASAEESLVLGNQLLLALDSQYPTQQRFKVRQHTVDAVSSILKMVHFPPIQPQGKTNRIASALDCFIGYVMLDAWIANQDRHHENWGALIHQLLSSEQILLRLAPTFDHGGSLARNITDDERRERLITRDRNRTMDAFAQRARSAFYRTENDNRALTTREAFVAFADRAPTAADAWLTQLSAVDRIQIWDIIEVIPGERMSQVCKEFTLELLLVNQRRLLDLRNP